MVWYSQHTIAFAMYVPAAVAGALTPFLFTPVEHRAALMGTATVLSASAALMTAAGLGSGFLLAMWAGAAVIACPAQPKVSKVWCSHSPTATAQEGLPSKRMIRLRAAQARPLLRLLFLSAGPVMLSLPMLFLLANILMDKASLLGVLPPPLGPAVSDAIVGAVVGLAVALCSSSIVPWVGTVLSRRHVQVSSCNFPSLEDSARASI